jgi:DNA-3-methyladenine glycosylase II
MNELIRPIQLFSSEWATARQHWKDADPRLFAVTPPEPIERIMELTPTPFGALVRAIGHQQVSIYAGRAIVGRLVNACGGELDPQAMLRLTDEEIRAAGLSRQKVLYVRAIAETAVNGDFDRLYELDEAEVTARLVQIPGVGVWTAKMFCIFHLELPDVFSGGDLGLREGIRILDGDEAQLSPLAAEKRAEAWSPYRSVAAISLWDLVRRTRLGLEPAQS